MVNAPMNTTTERRVRSRDGHSNNEVRERWRRVSVMVYDSESSSGEMDEFELQNLSIGKRLYILLLIKHI